MKCPKCGNELEEGKLLCEQCGEEIKIVPDFDIELEAQMDETISNIVENISVDENSQQVAEADEPQKTEADEQEDERPGRTDGRQRLIAEKPTDDQRVRRIVKLLKDLTEEHGHGKLRDQLPRTAFRHIQRTSAQGASFPSLYFYP